MPNIHEEELRRLFVKAAQERQKDGELEIDDNADVSFGDDDGAYVEAWIWVSNAEAGIGDQE